MAGAIQLNGFFITVKAALVCFDLCVCVCVCVRVSACAGVFDSIFVRTYFITIYGVT
jgi:hypothetical protein